jgi:hypothetical protein
MALAPTPLPDDDLEFYSDILLSLETRNDITAHLLLYAKADKTLETITGQYSIHNDDEQHGISRRVKALRKHWRELHKQFDDSVANYDFTTDFVYPPLVTTIPDGKLPSWKLQLNEERTEDSRKLHAAFIAQRLNSLSYFRTHPSATMAWVPADGNAWKETQRSKIESGDLHHSKRWTPLYKGWSLQIFDVPLSWVDPDADEATREKREEEISFDHAWTRRSLSMRAEERNGRRASRIDLKFT